MPRPRCAACKGELTDAQVAVVRLLWRNGCHVGEHGQLPYCETCWPEVKEKIKKPTFKKYVHAGYRERALVEAKS